jgi:TonB family protein
MNSRASLVRLVASWGGLCLLGTAAAQLPTSLQTYKSPSFPAELKGTLTTAGYTTIAYVVRSDGSIDDAVVLEASHVAFAEAAMAVVPDWRFEPIPNTLPRREVLRLQFSQTDAIKMLSHLDSTRAAFPLSQSERLPIRTLPSTELEQPLERVSTITPRSSVAGQVAVSYVIDTEGRVRVPTVTNAPNDQVALAVVEAVKQWRFKPSMHEGVPVLVEDRRSFTFAPRP